MKKIAFVHDRIYHIWWAESVMKWFISEKIEKLHDCEIMIFCWFSNLKYLDIWWKRIPIISTIPYWLFGLFTWSDRFKIPIISWLLDYRNLMFFFPIITFFLSKKISKYQFDEINVDSFAFVKNISISQPYHLYLHQPMQYIWSLYDHNLSKLKAPISWFYCLAAWYLRPWDKKYREYWSVTCNSLTTQQEALSIYWIKNSKVLYPAIEPYYLKCIANLQHSDYYVFVGRIVIFLKDVDRIVQLFNQSGKKIKIIWTWPDFEKLQKIAHPNVEFLWAIYGQEKYEIVANSCWLISLWRESFGMTAIEALCQWVPVFCYEKSASSEFICKKTGLLVHSLDINSMIHDLNIFEKTQRDSIEIQKLWRKRYIQFRP